MPASLIAAQSTADVVMLTTLGEIEIELYGDNAPVTVGNFLKLVDGQHLDSGEFYRVVTLANDNGSPKIEVIQGGLNNRESPFPAIAHESTDHTEILHTDGVLSMARGEVGTASSEFFICIGDQPGLDFGQPRNADGQGFAAFGRVTNGMDVVRRIKQTGAAGAGGEGYTAGQVLREPIKILSVRRKG
ncbi:MAG: peptidyl-prolyl cis-trans isomerase A (cyclophilin A) [Pseudohongiellaceae bacterium]